MSELHDFLYSRKITLETAEIFGITQGVKYGRPAAKYPTPCGVQRVRFLDAGAMKYVWAKKGGRPCWYGLEETIDACEQGEDAPIWIVNGEPSVWQCYQAGVVATCTLGGETSIPDDATLCELINTGRDIRIAFDADDAGKEGAQKLAFALKQLGADSVQIRGWSQVLDELELQDRIESNADTTGFDVDDLAQCVGSEKLSEWLTDLEIVPLIEPDKPEPRSSSHWHVAGVVLERLRRKNGPKIVFTNGRFWRYSQAHGIWESLGEKAVPREVGSLDGCPIGHKKVPLKVAASTVSSVQSCAEDQAYRDDWFSDAPVGLNCTNGFLSSADWRLKPKTPGLKQIYTCGVSYDADARCPRFIESLNVWLGDGEEADKKRMLLQEFAGAILFGITGKSLWLLGEGSNGKSTALEVLSGLIPDGLKCSVSPQKMSSGHQAEYYIAHLAGKRLNVDSDISAKNIEDSSEFKKSVTGDELMGRDPAGKPFQFRPRIVHLFAANEFPRSSDHTHGFWRRIIPLDFDRDISECVERVDFYSRVLLEQEKPGIIAWAVEGAKRRLANGGYTIPESSDDTKKGLKAESNQVLAFMDEWCDGGDAPMEWVQASEVFEDYERWAKKNRHALMSSTSFGRRMRQLGYTEANGLKKRSSDGYYYRVRKDFGPSWAH